MELGCKCHRHSSAKWPSASDVLDEVVQVLMSTILGHARHSDQSLFGIRGRVHTLE